MKSFKFIFFTFICALAFVQAQSNGKVIIRLDWGKAGIIRQTLPPTLDIAGQNLKKQTLDIVGSQEYFELLKNSGYPVSIAAAQPAEVDSRYLTPEKINAIIQDLAAKYPELVHVEKIGDSIQGRPINAVRISSPQNVQFKPAILFNAMHHAREIMTPEIVVDMMYYLTANYTNTDTPEVAAWVNGLAIWLVPQVNPDGNTIVWTSDNWWRKNARGDGNSTWGVDLNRNYPYQWGACNGSSGDPSSETYRGAAPASEPETGAIMKFVRDQNIAVDVSYHSYSELVISPYGCEGEITPEDPIIGGIGAEFAKKLVKDAGQNTYDYGSPWQLLYPVDGDDISWMYHDVNTMAYVVEVNSSAQGFQPDYDTWRNKTVLGQRPGWEYLLTRLLAGAQVRGRMLDAKTGQPVDGFVSISGAKYTTEKPRSAKDGIYEKLLVPGQYELIFSAPGYESQTLSVSVDNNGAVPLDVYFEKSTIF